MLNHYKYNLDQNTNTYIFTTKNKILYKVAFCIDETFATISGEKVSDVFQLVIEKATDEREPFDSMVSKTIEHIVEQFFSQVKNSLIYVCSNDNERALIRFNVFDRWYKNASCRNEVIKLDNVLQIQVSKKQIQKLYTSFLMHKSNPNKNQLIRIYNQIEEVLNDEK